MNKTLLFAGTVFSAFVVSLATPITTSILPASMSEAELEVEDNTSSKVVTWASSKTRMASEMDRVVIHCAAALKTADGKNNRPLSEWFARRHLVSIWSKNKVGPHYVIERDGHVSQWVADERIAMHATVYNTRSIGIELIGLNEEASVVKQLEASVPERGKRDSMRAFTTA